MSKYKFKDASCKGNPVLEFDTITAALEYFAVCESKKHDDDVFEIAEKCDSWFGLTLTKQQLKDYANELLELAES